MGGWINPFSNYVDSLCAPELSADPRVLVTFNL